MNRGARSGGTPGNPAPIPETNGPTVRFDSFDPRRGARSFRFDDLREILRADRLDEVTAVLERVERAAAEGMHAAGFVAYEAAPAFDPALAVHPPAPELPLAWFALYGRRTEIEHAGVPAAGDAVLGAWSAALSEEEYARRIGRIRELIAAGDTYQVNFTFGLRAPFEGDPEVLYERLCRSQRSAYCAFLQFGDHSILCASPELFFRWSGGVLELRPMKGTRPRGRWLEEDHEIAAELAGSAKDRAENLMIVDLLRNDAGRVADFGSVAVPALFEVERYPTVHQLTSTITARTRPGTTLANLFRALFPCGSVTGAPKVRTSEVIVAMEDGPRGVYTGVIGMVSPGEAHFNVAIRTLVTQGAGEMQMGVGSGITYGSVARDEFRECLDKAEFAHRDFKEFQLLETLLYEPDAGFFLLEAHLARMAGSADYFGYGFDRDAAAGYLHEAVAGAADSPQRVRLLLDRRGKCTAEGHPLNDSGGDLRVAISAEPVHSAEVLLYHKTTERDHYRARAAARPDCDDVVLVNEAGHVTESTIANVVVRVDGTLVTPPVRSGLLPGVFRAELLRTGQVREQILTPEDLQNAEEWFLVNSVRRWRRARLVP